VTALLTIRNGVVVVALFVGKCHYLRRRNAREVLSPAISPPLQEYHFISPSTRSFDSVKVRILALSGAAGFHFRQASAFPADISPSADVVTGLCFEEMVADAPSRILRG